METTPVTQAQEVASKAVVPAPAVVEVAPVSQMPTAQVNPMAGMTIDQLLDTNIGDLGTFGFKPLPFGTTQALILALEQDVINDKPVLVLRLSNVTTTVPNTEAPNIGGSIPADGLFEITFFLTDKDGNFDENSLKRINTFFMPIYESAGKAYPQLRQIMADMANTRIEFTTAINRYTDKTTGAEKINAQYENPRMVTK